MTTSFAEFAGVWKIAAANYLLLVVLGLILLIHLKLKYGMGFKEFFMLNKRIFLFSASTVNGSASMMLNMDVCKNDLKINPNFCEFWVPLSHALFAPGTLNTLVICAFVGASMSNATISPAQMLLIAFLSMQLSIVVPRVYGSNLAVFTMLLTQMGFTQDAIGPMMVADVFTVNSMSFFGMFIRNCEFYDLSRQVNFQA